MSLSDEDFSALLSSNGISALSPADMAKDFVASDREWYHLQFYESDFPLFISLANVKWYSLCRCRARGKKAISSDNIHLHALIHFIGYSSLWTFKKKLRQIGKQVNGKTRFKKILWLEQACEVLERISCDGFWQDLPNHGDGFHSTPHIHFSRIVFDKRWLHERLYDQCLRVKNKIAHSSTYGLCDRSEYTTQTALLEENNCSLSECGEGSEEQSSEVNRKRLAANALCADGFRAKEKKCWENMREKQKLIIRLRELHSNCFDAENVNTELIRQTVNELIKL